MDTVILICINFVMREILNARCIVRGNDLHSNELHSIREFEKVRLNLSRINNKKMSLI